MSALRYTHDVSPKEQRPAARPLKIFSPQHAGIDSRQADAEILSDEAVNEAPSPLQPRYSSPVGSISRDAFDRPPDWRWQRALWQVVENLRFPRRSLDSVTRQATSFVAGLTGAKEGRIRLSARFMEDATLAWRLRQQPVLDSLRHTIELCMLADMPPEQISRESGLSLTAVTFYEQLFWDLRDRLDLTLYIDGCVLNFGLPDDESGRIAREVRALAYAGGPIVAKTLLQRGEFPAQKPLSATEVGGFFRQSTLSVLQAKACLAMRLLDPSKPKDALLLLRFNTALQRLEQKKSKKTADPPWNREQQRAAIEAFQRSLPRDWKPASQAVPGSKPAQD